MLCVLSFSFLLLPLLNITGMIIKTKTNICESKECIAAAKKLKDSMDMKTKPCEDFYKYACGNWKTFAPSPIESRYLQNNDEIREYLKQNNDKNENEAIHKARKFYSLCMNGSYDEINQTKQLLSKIGVPYLSFWTEENTEFDYVAATAKALKIASISMFFDVVVHKNPYNHSINAIWLSTPTKLELLISKPEMMKIAERPINESLVDLQNIIKEMCGADFPLFCRINDLELVTNVLEQQKIRSQIIEETRTKTIRTNSPIVYNLEDLQKKSDILADEVHTSIPKWNWTRFIETLFEDIENVTLDLRNPSELEIIVEDMDFVQNMIKFIHARKIKEIELGLWLELVNEIVFQVRKKFRTPLYRAKCIDSVSSLFGIALSHMYSEKDQNGKTKTEVEEMVNNIKESYRKLFKEASWMDQKTREMAIRKLSAMKSLIAYPNSNELSAILDEKYGNIKIGANYIATEIGIYQDMIKKNYNELKEINYPTRAKWPTPPSVVNAFYSPESNLIIIPAAILGEPLYRPNNSKALLYGMIGSVVGHEMGHGFDPNGWKFNDVGELEEWWEDDTMVKYDERSNCFSTAYDSYKAKIEGFEKVNATSTLNEDIADNEGFKAALYAYRSYVDKNGKGPALVDFETFTHEQLFTLGFAYLWCEKPTYYKATDEHSPHEIRLSGVLKNSKEFAEIWNCPKNSEMNPVEKCSLW